MIEEGIESYEADFNLPDIIKDLKKRKLDEVQKKLDGGMKAQMSSLLGSKLGKVNFGGGKKNPEGMSLLGGLPSTKNAQTPKVNLTNSLTARPVEKK